MSGSIVYARPPMILRSKSCIFFAHSSRQRIPHHWPPRFLNFVVILISYRRFYVGCDMCANWFHGACVQVSPETAKNMDEWTCADCTQARRGVEEEELYCLCRQPYDERKYVLCFLC